MIGHTWQLVRLVLLCTMSVLQAYQADLLKDLDQDQGQPPRPEPEHRGGPGPSWSAGQIQGQVNSPVH